MALYFSITVLLVASSIQFAACIKCYECNSVNNSMCLDPTLYDADTLQKYIRSTNCEQGVFTANHQEFFCRKIVQTGHDSELRVIRGCGWVRHHRDCYKADNEDHLETVCQCFKDDCNAAASVKYSLGSLVTAICILGLRFLINK